MLSLPDLPSLHSLVRASPSLHAQYREESDQVLPVILGRELEGSQVDAYANLMSRVRKFGSPRTDAMIKDFLATYDEWLQGSKTIPDLTATHPGNVRWMAGFHLSVVRRLTRLYAEWALGYENWVVSSSPEWPKDQVNLSSSERTRISSAMYRYQVYCHIFGRNKGKRRRGFRHHEIAEIMWSRLNPWDVDAVACIAVFVRAKYTALFKDVIADLRPGHPRFIEAYNGYHHPCPDGSFNLDGEYDCR